MPPYEELWQNLPILYVDSEGPKAGTINRIIHQK